MHRTSPQAFRPSALAVRKPFQFLAALGAMLLVDALTPRYPDWPPALISFPRSSVPPPPLTKVEPIKLEPVAPHPVHPPPVAAVVTPPIITSPGPKVVPIAKQTGPLLVPDDPRWTRLVARFAQRKAGEPSTIRVLHLGDSEIANDDLAGTLRQRFAARYGDAGPGFVLALAPWSWYLREGFESHAPEGFSSHGLPRSPSAMGNFGPGGAFFDARAAGATAKVGLDPSEHATCEVTLSFGTQPNGASVAIAADGKALGEVETAGALGVGTRTFHVAPCPHELSARAVGVPARLFGWSVEWGTPGVVWSTLGYVGATAHFFLSYEKNLLGDALASLQPDLVIAAHGLNDADKANDPPESEAQGLRRLLDEVHRASPEAACLVMSPYPIAFSEGGALLASPSLPALIAQQRRVALAANCAFLDRTALEGGPDQALAWLSSRPRILSADHVHLTRFGAQKVGDDVAEILLSRLGEGR